LAAPMPKKGSVASKKPPKHKKSPKPPKKPIVPKKVSDLARPPTPLAPATLRSPSPFPLDETDVSDIGGGDVIHASFEDSSGIRRRKLARRDTEDAASRAIEQRLLKYYSKSAVEGATNKKGLRIHDVVSEQIRSNRSDKKNLTSRFWEDVIVEFGLKVVFVTDQLADPAEDGSDVSVDVLEKLGSAHCDNPAHRTTEPLERFLEHCPVLSYAELYGILCASMESQKVLRAASTMMLMAALKYIARFFAGCTRSYAEFCCYMLVFWGC
jgi:hypothetical protein